jgi:hypothetical protein
MPFSYDLQTGAFHVVNAPTSHPHRPLLGATRLVGRSP